MQGRLGYGVLEMLTDLGDWTKKGAPKFYTGTVDGTNTYLEHLPYRLDVASATIGVSRFMVFEEPTFTLRMWIECRI
ncbi:hypothetical protein NXX52_07245 [Bacteroides ovatus]|nr:hypothetical protein [Bacteroides ovatus]